MSDRPDALKTMLICHEGALLDEKAMPRWLASFSEVSGVIIIREKSDRYWARVRREIERIGWFRLIDVFLFRIYYRLFLQSQDKAWQAHQLEQLLDRYEAPNPPIPVCYSHSPNSKEVRTFMLEHRPDLLIARCKSLLKARIFSIPTKGTFVMHPGVCPEYRNAHGCFWALVRRDLGKVGMTLLCIDKGIDTGPVYGYFNAAFDEVNESHNVIQERVVYDNLDAIARTLIAIGQGKVSPLDTRGRPSAEWGQPWLTSYLKWKYLARRSS